jgi:predicted alpha/beta hydrolase
VKNPEELDDAVDALPVRVRAADGYELAGSLYSSGSAPATPARAALLHCGGGIRAARYRRFARYLASRGIPTLTYDYRGIGASRPASLRGLRAAIEDWAEYDCAGAIAWLRQRYGTARIVGIAHSVGALLVGGAPNAAEQSRLVLIGAHTGYYGDYRERYRLPMTLLWHALMPALTRVFGYFPARRLGLGEDLPANFALQWARRRSPELRPTGTDPGSARVRRLLDRCAALQRPALLVSISDDAFATPAGTRRLMACYPRLSPLQHLQFTPADAGLSRIGHFGFFSRSAGAVLWPRLHALLEAEPG